MYFHTDNKQTINWLRGVLEIAEHNGQSVRFDVDSQGRLKVKRGESMWTAPIDSTPDPYRDLAGQYGGCQAHADIHRLMSDCIGFQRV